METPDEHIIFVDRWKSHARLLKYIIREQTVADILRNIPTSPYWRRAEQLMTNEIF